MLLRNSPLVTGTLASSQRPRLLLSPFIRPCLLPLGFGLLLTIAGSRQSYGQNLPVAEGGNLTIAVTINTATTHEISPLIYGINAFVYDAEWKSIADWKVGLDNVAPGINTTNRRIGGNTMTSYNWENGYCNSGTPTHDNNDFQSFISGAGDPPYAPGAALTTFHDQSLQLGAYSLLQLPCAGYVAADNTGDVSAAQSAPSSRWKALSFAKPGAPASYTNSPDLNDGTVYVDEELNFLISKYGAASTATGVPAYELDNEPGLWHLYPNGTDAGTHPRLHTDLATCQDLLNRNVQLAGTIKRMDPAAKVFGPAMWGFPEYYSYWSVYDGASHQPSDWPTFNTEPYTTNNTGDEYRYNHMTWVNAYLAKMKQYSDAAGTRLLDVFSVHYYALDANDATTRVQAPRSLWDPTYVENSYITQNGNGFTDGRGLALIPKLQQAIADFYPDTKLAITEWDFGGRHDVSGVIAQADALGIFGKTGLYAANYFFPIDDYIAAAFRIYRNYDGQNSAFGKTGVEASTSDVANNSTYASLDDAGRLHVIVINKNLDRTEDVMLSVHSDVAYDRVAVYRVDASGSTIQSIGTLPIAMPSITYSAPKASVTHLVLSGSNAVWNSPGEDHTLRLTQNPVSSSTLLTGYCKTSDFMVIEIVDGLGRVRSIIRSRATQGIFSQQLDVSALRPGTYRVVCHLGGSVEVVNLVKGQF